MAEDERTLRDEEKLIEGDEEKFRRYLLGLSPPEESAEVERAILVEDVGPTLNVIEDELVEDYVTGELSKSDRSHFEERLLFSQDTVEKIRVSAMLLGRPDVVENVEQRLGRRRQVIPAHTLQETQVLGRAQARHGNEMAVPSSTEVPVTFPAVTAKWAARRWFAVGAAAIVIAGAVSIVSFKYFFRNMASLPQSDTPLSSPVPPRRSPVPSVTSASVAFTSVEPGWLDTSRDALPTMYEVAPVHPRAEHGILLTLNGSNFVDGAIVECNRQLVHTEFVDSSKIHAYISLASLGRSGTAEILVVNPSPGGFGASAPLKITITAPGKTRLQPPKAPPTQR
jgi:hypothetical protein